MNDRNQKKTEKSQVDVKYFYYNVGRAKGFLQHLIKVLKYDKDSFHCFTFRRAGNVQQALLLYLLNSYKQKTGGWSFGYSCTNAFYIFSTEQLTVTNLSKSFAQILSTQQIKFPESIFSHYSPITLLHT